MPLPLPTLDRLAYDELVSEARSSLPALAPGWTDYNAHDPGITLVELLAWLAEGASYCLDNIPDKSYRAFLRLAGVELCPALVAETLLVFAPNPASQNLLSGVRVQSQAGKVMFQTTMPLFVSDAQLEAVVSGAGTTLEDLTVQNSPSASALLPFSSIPQPGDALYLGLNRALAPQDCIVSLGVWTGNSLADLATRTQLAVVQKAVEDDAARLCPKGMPPNQPDWRQHYGARTVWEYYAGSGDWQPLKDVEDTTRALTLSGTVRFKAPAPNKHAAGGVPLPGLTGKHFIRCRLKCGAYDCPPRIAYIALNAVEARHAVDVPPQTFRSDGQAGQSFGFDKKPVVPESIKMSVTLNGVVDGEWHAAPFYDGVGPHDRTCLLEAESGMLLFGDGRNGRVPPAAAEIKVDYQTGSGPSGNVVANTLNQLAPGQPDVTVNQPFATCGGAAAETLNEAKARAVRELATPTRAVTLDDFEALALATPGVPLVRAHAIAEYHPGMPCIPVTGSTTVVVVPRCPEHRPEPTAALVANVLGYLERRRLLASEIHVVGPHYTTVAVSAHLAARPEVDRRALIFQAHGALERFFHPLHGGPDGHGWPIGRSVYRSELLALLNGLDDVLYVEEMIWHVDGKEASRCGNITICRHGLVASGIHKITINEGSGGHE